MCRFELCAAACHGLVAVARGERGASVCGQRVLCKACLLSPASRGILLSRNPLLRSQWIDPEGLIAKDRARNLREVGLNDDLTSPAA